MDRINDTSEYELSTSQDRALYEEESVISLEIDDEVEDLDLAPELSDSDDSLTSPSASTAHNPSLEHSLSSAEDYSEYSDSEDSDSEDSTSSKFTSSVTQIASDSRSSSPFDLFDSQTEPFLDEFFATEVSEETQTRQNEFTFFGKNLVRTALRYAEVEFDPISRSESSDFSEASEPYSSDVSYESSSV